MFQTLTVTLVTVSMSNRRSKRAEIPNSVYSSPFLVTCIATGSETFPLADDELLVRLLRSEFVDLPAGPANDDCIHSCRRAQAEMDARVARTLEAASGAHLGVAGRALGGDLDLGAEAIAVRLAADGLDPQPVAGGRDFIPQQHGRSIEVGDEQILTAAIPEVRRQRRAAHIFFRQGTARSLADFFELSFFRLVGRQVVKQERPLGIAHTEGLSLHLRIHVTIRDENVGPAVVVVVEKLHAKTEIGIADGSDSRSARQVGELAIVIVVIK